MRPTAIETNATATAAVQTNAVGTKRPVWSLRDDVVVHEGELSTLKRFKDEVARVESGVECGMAFKNYQDMRKGDVIECFTVEMIERSL